jgi:integrase
MTGSRLDLDQQKWPRRGSHRPRPGHGRSAPVTTSSYGAKTRRPVFTGNRRVAGLYERRLADGSTVYDVALRLGGKVRRHRLEAATKTDAITELRALQVDYGRGETHRSPASTPTVAELARDWIAHLEARIGHRGSRRRYSARTVALYRQKLATYVLPELGHRPVPDVGLADVRRLVDRLGAADLAPSTVTGTLGILSGLLRFGVKGGLLERNPVGDLDRDDRPGAARLTEPRYLSAAELELLLASVTDTFRPAVATCAFAALRISEALGLRWRDVDFAAATIAVTGQLGANGERVPVKTAASAATLPMLPALARELREHRSRQAGRDLRRVQADALVFTTSRGKPQSRRNALRALHAAGEAAGLNGDGREPVGLHDLRHSFVALALASGVSLAEAAALARHANARVTAQVYAGLTEDGRERATAKLVDAGFGA